MQGFPVLKLVHPGGRDGTFTGWGLSGGGLLNRLVERDGLGKMAGLFAPGALPGRFLFMGWDAGIIMVKCW